ncbi:MAG: GDP-mannose 4,6-dehydratase [Porcipelethomonas sp.]
MNKDRKVLIFGVSGFVGHYLSEEFNNHGYDVSGCDLAKSSFVPDYVKFKVCDILDEESVKECILSTVPDYIINLAAISSVGQSWIMPQKTVAVNVQGALNILETVRSSNSSAKILLIGSSEEYASSDNPISENAELNGSNPYGISKIMQEKYAELYRKKYGMTIFYVRAFNHIGPGQSERFVIPSWCRQVAEISRGEKNPVMKIGNTHVKRDFSDVRDVVRAYRMILEKGDREKMYNVGSGNIICLNDILLHLISLSNAKVTVVVDESLIRKNEASVIWCDNSLIKSELNWAPEHNLFDTITEIYNMYI